jgi:PPOX class probable F420-dependent enzyme
MSSEPLASLPDWAGRMLGEERVGHMGLVDDRDHPRVLPVTFAVHDAALWSPIDTKPKRREPARLRYLARRPRATVTVDRYGEDWSELAWVQVLCSVEIVDAARARDALAALAAKYDQYRDSPPPGPVLRLVPDRALCWRAAGDRI